MSHQRIPRSLTNLRNSNYKEYQQFSYKDIKNELTQAKQQIEKILKCQQNHIKDDQDYHEDKSSLQNNRYLNNFGSFLRQPLHYKLNENSKYNKPLYFSSFNHKELKKYSNKFESNSIENFLEELQQNSKFCNIFQKVFQSIYKFEKMIQNGQFQQVCTKLLNVIQFIIQESKGNESKIQQEQVIYYQKKPLNLNTSEYNSLNSEINRKVNLKLISNQNHDFKQHFWDLHFSTKRDSQKTMNMFSNDQSTYFSNPIKSQLRMKLDHYKTEKDQQSFYQNQDEVIKNQIQNQFQISFDQLKEQIQQQQQQILQQQEIIERFSQLQNNDNNAQLSVQQTNQLDQINMLDLLKQKQQQISDQQDQLKKYTSEKKKELDDMLSKNLSEIQERKMSILNLRNQHEQLLQSKIQDIQTKESQNYLDILGKLEAKQKELLLQQNNLESIKNKQFKPEQPLQKQYEIIQEKLNFQEQYYNEQIQELKRQLQLQNHQDRTKEKPSISNIKLFNNNDSQLMDELSETEKNDRLEINNKQVQNSKKLLDMNIQPNTDLIIKKTQENQSEEKISSKTLTIIKKHNSLTKNVNKKNYNKGLTVIDQKHTKAKVVNQWDKDKIQRFTPLSTNSNYVGKQNQYNQNFNIISNQ